jgi:hypothetical protein
MTDDVLPLPADVQCCAVPLIEQLRSVPKEAREMIEEGYCAHRNIPYGRMCHEAASALERAEQQNTELRAEVERLKQRQPAQS